MSSFVPLRLPLLLNDPPFARPRLLISVLGLLQKHFCSIYIPAFIRAYLKLNEIDFDSPFLFLFDKLSLSPALYQYILTEEEPGTLLKHQLSLVSRLDVLNLPEVATLSFLRSFRNSCSL